MNEIQNSINKLRHNNFTNDELIEYLEGSTILIKVNSILAIIRLGISTDEILKKLSQIASRVSEEPKVFGIWNNAHFAIVALKLLNTPKSLEQYEKVINKLDSITITDIERLAEHLPGVI